MFLGASLVNAHVYIFLYIYFYLLCTEEKNNDLLTRLCHKSIDHKLHLHFHSSHPWKQKKSVPYGLLIRCKGICNEERYFEEEAQNILRKLTRKIPTQPTN